MTTLAPVGLIGRSGEDAMRAAVLQTGAPHLFLSFRGRLHHEVGAAQSACLRVVCESGRKGFGGGEDYQKKAKKQGGGSGKQQLQGGGGVRREDNKRAVAVKEGSRQLQNVLRSVDKVKMTSIFRNATFFPMPGIRCFSFCAIPRPWCKSWDTNLIYSCSCLLCVSCGFRKLQHNSRRNWA